MSVREMVKAMQAEMLKGEMLPERQREVHARLSALLGNCNDEIREADAAYGAVLLILYGVEKTANRAKIRAEITPEFARKRTAKDMKELVIEMIRTLRQNMRSLDEEMRLAR